MNAPEVAGLDRRVAGVADALPEAVGLTRGRRRARGWASAQLPCALFLNNSAETKKILENKIKF